MKRTFYKLILLLIFAANSAFGAPAIKVLGKDYTFPNKLEGFPEKLSDLEDLEINFFTTSDNVKLTYWEAGKGEPLIISPAWSAGGADFINVIHLLSKNYHVYVIDYRNQAFPKKLPTGCESPVSQPT